MLLAILTPSFLPSGGGPCHETKLMSYDRSYTCLGLYTILALLLVEIQMGEACALERRDIGLMRAHIRSRVPLNDSNAETGAEEIGNQLRAHPSLFCGQSQGGPGSENLGKCHAF